MADFGIEVLRSDKNTKLDQPIKDFSLTSSVPSHKIFIESHGTATLNCSNGYWYKETVQHDLGYYPPFFIYYKNPDTNKWITPFATLDDYYAVGMQVTIDVIRFHIMYIMGFNAGGACPPCTDIGTKSVEYKYMLIVDPLYEP